MSHRVFMLTLILGFIALAYFGVKQMQSLQQLTQTNRQLTALHQTVNQQFMELKHTNVKLKTRLAELIAVKAHQQACQRENKILALKLNHCQPDKPILPTADIPETH